ncbi:MAG: sirohydrochlorin chelatase [Cyanobacteria bacterium J06629_2]
MISSYAYLLVFHGSRDCRTQTAALNLRDLLLDQYQSNNILTQHNYLEKRDQNFEPLLTAKSTVVPNSLSTPLIEVAALELAPQSLCESLVNFAHLVNSQGLKQIKVVPLFLAPGVHVCSDIPAEIALATNQLDRQVIIELSPYLGKYSGIVNLLTRRFAELSAKTRILIAHGSKSPLVADYYQTLGSKLNTDVAYWSTEPRFIEQIETKIAAGSQEIALLPYFLFPGKITQAIARKISELQQKYPHVELRLGQPLGATAALAELIAREV